MAKAITLLISGKEQSVVESWTPPTVAKRAGYDWKTLSKEDRRIVADVTRLLYHQHQELTQQYGQHQGMLIEALHEERRRKDKRRKK